MIADRSKFEAAINVVATASPIREDFLRSLFSQDIVVLREEMIFAAAMAMRGFHEEAISQTFSDYRRICQHLGDKI